MAEKRTNQQEISICVTNLTSRKSGISVAKRRRIPMKRMLSILLMLMLVPCAALAEEEDEPVTPMHELTMAHGFRFGGALSCMQLWDTNYLNFLKTHCNSITATNEMKAYSLLDQSKSRASSDGMPRMNFSAADKMVAGERSRRARACAGVGCLYDPLVFPRAVRRRQAACQPGGDAPASGELHHAGHHPL